MQAEVGRVYQYGLERLGHGTRYAASDGRPLVVGGCSKDPDARAGRAARGMGRGYKMHAAVDGRHVVLAYQIHPLSLAQQTVALSLLLQLPAHVTRVVGDKICDGMKLHRVAAASGRRLYAPPRQNRVGRRRQPGRLQWLRRLQSNAGRRLLHWRGEIERTFGNNTTVSFGFKGLPAWARHRHRVRRWMWGKTMLHHARLLAKIHAA